MSSYPIDETIALKLAVLYHDPPWKPWSLHTRAYSIKTETGAKGLDAIIKALRKELGEITGRDGKELSRWIEEATGDKSLSQLRIGTEALLKKALERLNFYINEHGFRNSLYIKDAKAHEIQGLLIPILLREAIYGLGEIKANLQGLVSVLRKTIEILKKRDKRVATADSLSSAFDRGVLYNVESFIQESMKKECEDKECKEKDYWIPDAEPVFKNIFDPQLQMKVKREIEAEHIAKFIILYIIVVVASLIEAKEPSQNLFYSTAYSLLEPLWYLVVGEPPPADTRIPTHTIFDHLSAAVATSNWVLETSVPKGCLVKVDLASVQKWIDESRRLRDLWASSWIASWLAWKSVEGLVEELGPDILIQPPARLHPFYTSWLLSRICGGNVEEGFCKSLAELLGLPVHWPLDPTVPSIVTLVLPSNECTEAKKKIAENYRASWEKLIVPVTSILKKVYDSVWEKREEICREDAKDGFKLTCRIAEHMDELEKYIRGIEPPLPLRVSAVKVEDALKFSRRICEGIAQKAGKNGDKIVNKIIRNPKESSQSGENIPTECEKLILYQTLLLLRDEESETSLRASGRRSGENYLRLAQSVHAIGAFRNCLVCGSGIAIADGGELSSLIGKHHLAREAEELARELGDERLCIYCLVKRLLRRILRKHAEELVGLLLEKDVYEKIGKYNLIEYTSRAKLGERKIEEIVEDLVKNKTLVEEAKRAAIIVPAAAEKTEENKNREREVIKAIVMEAFHDNALPKKLVEEGYVSLGEELKKVIEDREVSKYRRHYAIVLADGDFMGKGILQGNLNMEPEDYVDKALNIKSDKKSGLNAKEIVAKTHTFLVTRYWETVYNLDLRKRPCTDSGENLKKENLKKTLLVSLSYHFTVSRALAAQSLFDRNLVESLGGALIYSGGDDMLAIAPPAALMKERRVYPALLIAYLSRMSYWGERPQNLPESPDAATIIESIYAGRGFNRTTGGIVIPALHAYGRSTAVYSVDAKRPLWLAVEESHNILESKDNVVIEATSGEEGLKDILFIGDQNSSVTIIPFMLLKKKKKGEEIEIEKKLLRITESIFKLLGEIGDKEKGERMTTSILYDAVNYTRELVLLQEMEATDAQRRLVGALVSRNAVGVPEEHKQVYVNNVLDTLYPDGLYIKVRLKEDSRVKELMKLSPYAYSRDGEVLSPHVLQLIESIKIIRSGVGG